MKEETSGYSYVNVNCTGTFTIIETEGYIFRLNTITGESWYLSDMHKWVKIKDLEA